MEDYRRKEQAADRNLAGKYEEALRRIEIITAERNRIVEEGETYKLKWKKV